MLTEILEKLSALPQDQRAQLEKDVMEATKDQKWFPLPGPQTDAYFSEADITYYGGAGGGGKTDFGLGLAFTAHKRSLILRRKYTDLRGILDRAIEINGSRKGYNGSPPQRLVTDDGRIIDFGAAQHIGDEQSHQGIAHDLLYVDEAAQFAEIQIRFFMGWVRSTEEGQRVRVALGSNPPLSDEGFWLIKMFAPWLDPTHPNPAKPGELRYFVSSAGVDIEVDGPGSYDIDGESLDAMSRTFIPARRDDNPFLNREYKAQQDALPEHIRRAIRDGDFSASRRDHELQLIPSEWIAAAMDRWRNKPPEGVPQCAIGVDVAQGGDDKTVLARRHDGWFDEIIAIPGKETPNGLDVAGLVINHRRDQSKVIIDLGGGYGGSAYEQLKRNIDDAVIGYKGSEKSLTRTKDGGLRFYNRRAEVYTRIKEALDPSQPGGSPIFLPPDPELMADLCSIRLKEDDQHVLQLEPKKAMIERIGRSPDKGDAVTLAWYSGPKMATNYQEWQQGSRTPQVIMGHRSVRRRTMR